MGKASRRRTRGGRHTHTDYNMLRAAYEYEHMDNYVHQRRMRQTTIPVSQYDPPVPWLDRIGDIPILGKFIVLYIIMPILMLIVKIGEWRLENWRTDEDALVEFLSLPSRRARPFFHLHVFIHKSLMGPEGSAFALGWMWLVGGLFSVLHLTQG